MRFTETKLLGAFVIEPQKFEDERGFLAPSWSAEEFAQHGLDSRLVECNISRNHTKGTLRGLHFQIAPFAQPKLVRCTKGAIYDVAVDLRPESPTFKQWTAVELTESNHLMFYIPTGLAHGYQTLTDDAEVFYQMSEVYAPDHAAGVRWDDPAFAIEWPLPRTIINERDRNYPLFSQSD
jgi:dTDP-4-dehydrorhamnose 3,5-epimerase